MGKWRTASLFACLLLVAGGAGAQNTAPEFTMALTGDSIITRALSVYEEPAYLEMIEMIRGADVAFTNLEVLLHDYEMAPAARSGGTWMRADPKMADELAWAGFDLVAMANNHSGDYGIEGMLATIKHTRDAGIVGAGTGGSLTSAREAKFLETTKARVALISMSSTITPHSVAGRSRDDIPARPGQPVGENPERLSFSGETYVVGDALAVRTSPDEDDLVEIAAVVRNAKQLADYVIVTIHAHEGPNRMEPAEFLVTFAHAMIDAGADVFVGHGPHALRGIEVYEGKPIFYSLGDFVFQNETLLRLPEENYQAYDLEANHHVADFNDRRYDGGTRGFPATPEIWESVIAMPTFRGGELVSIKLHPISLQFGSPAWVRGRPLLANEELSQKILDDLIRVSAPFGTTIQNDDGTGVVVLR